MINFNPVMHNIEKMYMHMHIKMANHTFKILQCEQLKIFKVCLTILQHYA